MPSPIGMAAGLTGSTAAGMSILVEAAAECAPLAAAETARIARIRTARNDPFKIGRLRSGVSKEVFPWEEAGMQRRS